MATGHFTDAGFQNMMDVYFRAATAPSQFFVSLLNDTIVGTDNWADVSANELQAATPNAGYAQVAVTRDATGFPTLALDSSEMQIISKACTFTASGNWATSITAIALRADLATDQLISYANVPSTTLASGESYSVTIKLKLTKV
jgi:hypothetical protein